MKQLPNKDTLP